MKKLLAFYLPLLLLCWCKIINEPITTSYFEELPWYTSPRSGYAILTWYLSMKPNVFDADYFMWEPESLEYCQSNPDLRWSDKCPTDDVVIFIAGWDMKIPWELVLNWNSENWDDSINLWCIRDWVLYNYSYAEWMEDKQIFEDNKEAINYINQIWTDRKNRKTVTLKISKSAYNIVPRWLTNCDVNVQSVKILPY
jgi:hypothetical protein